MAEKEAWTGLTRFALEQNELKVQKRYILVNVCLPKCDTDDMCLLPVHRLRREGREGSRAGLWGFLSHLAARQLRSKRGRCLWSWEENSKGEAAFSGEAPGCENRVIQNVYVCMYECMYVCMCRYMYTICIHVHISIDGVSMFTCAWTFKHEDVQQRVCPGHVRMLHAAHALGRFLTVPAESPRSPGGVPAGPAFGSGLGLRGRRGGRSASDFNASPPSPRLSVSF